MSLVFAGFSVALRGRTLARLDETVAGGEVLALMGPSGSGKSSVLLAVAGLLGAPFMVAGRVVLDGREIGGLAADRRGVGMVFQDALLYPHMSVLQNVMFAVKRRDGEGRRRGREARRAIAMRHLARVAMEGFADRDPETLSGGQKSRVSLARTLAGEPRALLLDEPFSALDQALRGQTRAIVFALAREDRLPVLMVSHDPVDAEAAGANVIEIGALPSAGGTLI
ncbi:ATP-binding cassette domain-containing protein [Acuticoccus sp. M5D2P5]|uniref:ATP-binding cassette domain-containing protein n=1 Tax=Acuticoccus kalidii TaxID=2910977 RepID=UPI001F23EE35|nr:ATP-binding cassette domain-containing protein [Acuticoccus kalidii]MCF3935895.1 ATP-binding cassette domain-containing protein [Acuticoccus kalidii]